MTKWIRRTIMVRSDAAQKIKRRKKRASGVDYGFGRISIPKMTGWQ